MMQLPGRDAVRSSCSSDRSCPIRKANQLSSFIVARQRRQRTTGSSMLYQAPDQSNAPSPARAASLIEADPHDQREVLAARPAWARRSCAATRSSCRSTTRSSTCDRSTSRAPARSRCPRFNYVAVTYGEQRRARHERHRRGRATCSRARRPRPRRRPTTGDDPQPARARPPPRPRRPRHRRRPEHAAARQRDRRPAARGRRTSSSARRTRRSPTRTSRRYADDIKQAQALVARATALEQSSTTTAPTTTTTPVPSTHLARPRPAPTAPRARPDHLGRPRLGLGPGPEPDRRRLSGGPGIVTIWIVLIPGDGRPTPQGRSPGVGRWSRPWSRRRMHVAVQGIDLGKYKLGWHDTEQSVFKPKKGLNEEIVREISWRKSEPEWMTKFRLNALKRFERKPMLDVVREEHARHRLRRHLLLHQADRGSGQRLGHAPGRDEDHLRAARHPRSRAQVPRRRHRAVRKRSRLPQEPGRPRGAGDHLHRHGHRGARVPRAREAVLRDGDPARRQQVRRAQLGGVVGWLVHLRAAGRARRHAVAGVLPHQRGELRASSSAR